MAAVVAAAVVAGVAGAPLLLAALAGGETTNPLHHGLGRALLWGDSGLVTLNPRFVWNGWGPAGLVALAASPWMIANGRRDPGPLFLAAALVPGRGLARWRAGFVHGSAHSYTLRCSQSAISGFHMIMTRPTTCRRTKGMMPL